MKKMKKALTSAALALSIGFGGASLPAKDANAGMILMIAGSTAGVPAALGVAGLFGGFGMVVTSVYWGIAHADKAWYAWGLFMLDEQVRSGKVSEAIQEKYPEMDASIANELAQIAAAKIAAAPKADGDYQEILFTEAELSTVLNVLDVTQPELAQRVRQDLTQSSIK
jgi:hypothetical protein